jgi:DNA uptake protein ComE-like DNA-binding protein
MKANLYLLSIILFAFSCSTSKQQKEESNQEVSSEPVEETPATMESLTVLNPNFATAEEIAGISSLSDEQVQSIIAARPYLKTSDYLNKLKELLPEVGVSDVCMNVFLPINLNNATEEEMKAIPGVGDKMAHEFEEYRPYTSIQQFRREIGKYVDEEEVARFEKYVFVPVNLNTGTKEEILSIPGVGERMLHEFEEYRPYQSIEQFRREIGKYVDDDELARLERYVTL